MLSVGFCLHAVSTFHKAASPPDTSINVGVDTQPTIESSKQAAHAQRPNIKRQLAAFGKKEKLENQIKLLSGEIIMSVTA
jgi:hypothetical protein